MAGVDGVVVAGWYCVAGEEGVAVVGWYRVAGENGCWGIKDTKNGRQGWTVGTVGRMEE